MHVENDILLQNSKQFAKFAYIAFLFLLYMLFYI